MIWLAAALVLAALLVQRRNATRTGGGVGGSDTGGGGSGPGRGVKTNPKAAIFWIHKTPAGLLCGGYCDDVQATTGGIVCRGARLLDLSIDPNLDGNQNLARGVSEEKELWIPENNLRRLSEQSMGGLVLYHLTADGILDGGAGQMLFPGADLADSNRIRTALKITMRKRHESGASMNFWNWLATLPAAIVDIVGKLVTGGSISGSDFFGRKLAAGNFTILRKTDDLYQVTGSKWAMYWKSCPWPVVIEISPAGRYYAAEVGDR